MRLGGGGRAESADDDDDGGNTREEMTATLGTAEARRDAEDGSDVVRAVKAIGDGEGTNEVDASRTIGVRENGTEQVEANAAGSDELESNWRTAMMTVCAGVLEKSVQELTELYEVEKLEAVQMHQGKFVRFAQLPIELQPRDLQDYIIMSTLQVCDIFAMQNARSWLFNIMDRNGCGVIRREEFLRYASLMYPLCDPAVSRYVLNCLLNAQQLADDKRAASNPSKPAATTPSSPPSSMLASLLTRDGSEDLTSRDEVSASASESANNDVQVMESSYKVDLHTPSSSSSGGVRYDVWKTYVDKMQSVYDMYDAQWEAAKAAVGLDPSEPLIHCSGAFDHSETIPVVGRLYLSERYLVFMSGVGARNYVIRLSCVSEIEPTTLSFSMRDCVQIRVEPELKSVLKRDVGITAQITPATASSSATGSSSGSAAAGAIGSVGFVDAPPPLASSSSTEATAAALASTISAQAHAASNLVKLYSISGEPIIFSFPELGETRMRDRWLSSIRELVASHQLHVHLGFGSSGRPPAHDDTEWPPEAAGSPFRGDVPPPLLTVAAALNVLRTKALNAALGRTTWLLMLFSNLDDHQDAVKYYVDSIRSAKGADRQSWVTRTVQSIVENMEINSRLYEITEDEPFDVQKLGEVIIRFWELVQPAVYMYDMYESLLHWRNPPASILALLVCLSIAYMDWVNALPSILIFVYVALLLGLRVKLVGLRGSDAALAAASQNAQAAGMYEFVKSVHDALQAFQNVFSRYNRQLGKLETLHTWGVPHLTWTLVLAALGLAVTLLAVPSRVLFFVLTIDAFSRHFRHPSGAADSYWESIPESSRRVKSGRKPQPSSQRPGKQKVK